MYRAKQPDLDEILTAPTKQYKQQRTKSFPYIRGECQINYVEAWYMLSVVTHTACMKDEIEMRGIDLPVIQLGLNIRIHIILLSTTTYKQTYSKMLRDDFAHN